MKRVRNTTANITLVIIAILTIIIGVTAYFFASSILKASYPNCWNLINQDLDTSTNKLLTTIGALIFISVLFAITFGSYALLLIITSYILKRPIATSTNRFPQEYFISKYAYTDEDRRNKAQLIHMYYRAYTIKIELTFSEIEEIQHYLKANAEIVYDFPKSFLMPDNISWFQPRISHHTICRIMKELKPDGVVLLTYKYTFPKGNKVRRTSAVVRIVADLHHATYRSNNVTIICDTNQ